MANLSAIMHLAGCSDKDETVKCSHCFEAGGYCPHCDGRGGCPDPDCPDCATSTCSHCKGTGFCPECDGFGFLDSPVEAT